MLHNFIARIGAADVHLVGHVSNEELAAYYELADVFVCASEHEGFCVPLVESFHMGVPVLAYAATAVPSTMDGAGVLYTNKDPLHVAGADQRGGRRSRAGASASSTGSTRRSIGSRPRILRARCWGTWTTCSASPRREHPPVAFDFWDQVDRAEEYDEIKAHRPAAFQALPPTSGIREPGSGNRMIVNQWVPAAHKGDAIGDSARRVRGLLREMGHQSDLYAMTIDDDLRGDVIPWTDAGATRGDLTIFHFALVSPMTAAFARLEIRPRAAVSQRHAGALLRRLRRRRSSGWRCSAARI